MNEKWAHGGGLGPVVGGEVHSPAEGEAVQCLLSSGGSKGGGGTQGTFPPLEQSNTVLLGCGLAVAT